jgi:DNA-binding transcriptional MerR regulator
MAESLTIGELARRTGVTTSALRYYDELGLVRPTRRVSGHRRYAVDAVVAVGLVRFFQEVGFTLAETKLIATRKLSPEAWRALAVPSEKRQHDKPSSTPSSAPRMTSSTAPTSGRR